MLLTSSDFEREFPVLDSNKNRFLHQQNKRDLSDGEKWGDILTCVLLWGSFTRSLEH